MHAWHTTKEQRNEAEHDAWWIRWLVIPLIRPSLDNMRETELFLEADCQDIDYTIVSPPGLTNKPKSGIYLLINFFSPRDHELECLIVARVSHFLLPVGKYINRVVCQSVPKKL